MPGHSLVRANLTMAKQLFENCSSGRVPYSLPCKADLLLLRCKLLWLRQLQVNWQRLGNEDLLLIVLGTILFLLLLKKS